MPTGTSSFMGRGMGIDGEFQLTAQTAANDILTITGASSQAGDFMVFEDSAGTETFWVNSAGSIYSRASDTSGNAYIGIDCRGAVAAGGTAGFQATAGFRLTDSSDETGVWQLYPGLFYFVGVSCASMSGGRVAGISIQFNMAADYDGVSGDGCSFINFSDSSTQNVPTLFTFPAMNTSSSIFDSNVTTASTHSLRIWVGDLGASGAYYYIMLTSCTD